jgi:ATP-binding cassette subfamily F protein 3
VKEKRVSFVNGCNHQQFESPRNPEPGHRTPETLSHGYVSLNSEKPTKDSLIALEHIAMQFGGEYLFRDVTFTVRPSDRVGLVGPNGAGKSTLLRIIAGQYEPESGSINMPTGFTIGYLPQEPTLDEEAQLRSILAEALRAREDLIEIEEGLEEVQKQLEEQAEDHASEAYGKLIERFGDLHHRFEAGGGFELKTQAHKVLNGLGFSEHDLERPVSVFSGGWQMRLLLAKLLIAHPDGLLLDEPTNHLDLESLIWLEDFLKNYEGLIVLVSHDRTFLNSITNRTAEISVGGAKIEVFPGNYDFYEKAKAEREALLEAQAATLAARRKEIESFVERFRYKATKAKQAQSRIKMLERMERVELASNAPTVHFAFPPAQASGRMVFELEHAAKSYDGVRNIFDHVDLTIERGERIAFLGKNGEGKTTLGKILAGNENLTGGQLKIGYNVTIGYYAQHQAEALDPKVTVLETLESVTRAQLFHQTSGGAPTKSLMQVRSLLGAFLFQGDDVYKPVRVLSGGEKSRLALAKMLLEPVNTLILDEPTNHLDMASKEVVKEALLAFEGTVIVISHDRDFLDDLVDRVITFGGGHVKAYQHDLEQYLDELQQAELVRISQKRSAARMEKKESASKAPSKTEGMPSVSSLSKNDRANADAKERKRREAEQRQERSKRDKPLRDKIRKLEEEIKRSEDAKQTIEDAMLTDGYYLDPARVKKDAEQHAKLKATLDDLYFRWSGLAEELEKLAA